MCNKYFKNPPIPETKANRAALLEEPTWFFYREQNCHRHHEERAKRKAALTSLNVLLDS